MRVRKSGFVYPKDSACGFKPIEQPRVFKPAMSRELAAILDGCQARVSQTMGNGAEALRALLSPEGARYE